ncbi:hypothetical protein BT67DRAFT_439012 [Trichocladium antarcticum]|uniref:Ubiquinol-cytochrome c chaperone domain-containing protein n=1 Tax=Trichocladium antarcticum TaxID=1450529 RepID=A0AAN6URB3_9PEZI|nr:hypothetical protein BT67DRAFT_439012 [Trichocladium antarcticum]
MACRSTGFGQLPRSLAAPLRPSLAACAQFQPALARAMPTVLLPAANSTRSRTARRALHTSAPRQKFDLKKLLVTSVAERLATSKSTYYVYTVTERLHKACAKQAEYSIEEADRKAGKIATAADGEEIGISQGGPWHNELALPPTFSTWAHVTMLHMYLLVVRLRCMDEAAQQAFQSQLVNHFFYQAEARMELMHDLTSRVIRQGYLKDLFVQWRGLIMAYDEGIYKGDAVLASAVWRNLYKGREDVDARALAAVVSWMRAAIEQLGGLTNDEVEMRGESVFELPVADEFRAVDVPTAAMRVAFEQAGIAKKA